MFNSENKVISTDQAIDVKKANCKRRLKTRMADVLVVRAKKSSFFCAISAHLL